MALHDYWAKRYGWRFVGTAFVWVKTTQAGVPLGARGPRPACVKHTVEQCVAYATTKGRPYAIAEDVRQVIMAPPREHSRKPDEVYERIERLVGPSRSKVELFARYQREGWHSVGAEAPGEKRMF